MTIVLIRIAGKKVTTTTPIFRCSCISWYITAYWEYSGMTLRGSLSQNSEIAEANDTSCGPTFGKSMADADEQDKPQENPSAP